MIEKSPLYSLADEHEAKAVQAARRLGCDVDECTLANMLTDEVAARAAGDLATHAELFLRAGGTFDVWQWLRFERGERLALVIARERIARGEVHSEISDALAACAAAKATADAEVEDDNENEEIPMTTTSETERVTL